MVKAKVKAEKGGVTTRAQASAAVPSTMQEVEASNLAAVNAVQDMLEASSAGASPAQGPSVTPAKTDPSTSRLELLQSNSECVDHFLSLMIPVLVDVYSASVLSTVRMRALTGILKAINFAEAPTLQQALKVIPLHLVLSFLLTVPL
jgi:E3 ubiquitin-protein ligase TRIP12